MLRARIIEQKQHVVVRVLQEIVSLNQRQKLVPPAMQDIRGVVVTAEIVPGEESPVSPNATSPAGVQESPVSLYCFVVEDGMEIVPEDGMEHVVGRIVVCSRRSYLRTATGESTCFPPNPHALRAMRTTLSSYRLTATCFPVCTHSAVRTTLSRPAPRNCPPFSSYSPQTTFESGNTS